MINFRFAGAFALGFFAAVSIAGAHVTLATQEASVGSGYKAVLRVPHGCKGSATTAISVQIPPGVIAVKPQPKPGWTIEIARAKYDKPYDYYGSQLTEGVRTITWSGGKLPDEYYDEFAFNTFLTKGLDTKGMLYFPVVQTCEQGIDRWIEIPAEGKDADDYDTPAPGLKLKPFAGNAD